MNTIERIGPGKLAIGTTVVGWGALAFIYALGFDNEWPTFLSPFATGYLAAWLYRSKTEDKDEKIWVISGSVSAAVWIVGSFVWTFAGVYIRSLELSLGNLPFALVFSMCGAYCGYKASRYRNGLSNSIAVITGICNLCVVFFFVFASLARGSKWGIVLVVLGGLTVGFLLAPRIFRTVGVDLSTGLAKGRACLLVLLFAIWYALYAGPATEARYWVLDASAHTTQKNVFEFRLLDYPGHTITVFENEGTVLDDYLQNTNRARIPVVVYKIYQFGAPFYGEGNMLVTAIGGYKPNWNQMRMSRTFDGKLVEQLQPLTKKQAEERIGRPIADPRIGRKVIRS